MPLVVSYDHGSWGASQDAAQALQDHRLAQLGGIAARRQLWETRRPGGYTFGSNGAWWIAECYSQLAMENDDLLVVLKFLLLKLENLSVQLSAVQILLKKLGVNPEEFESKVQQLSDSDEYQKATERILQFGPFDAAIAQIRQALEAREKDRSAF